VITLDDDVYRPSGYHGCHESVVVTSDFDPAAVRTALQRAAVRFMRVDETGAEHPDDAAARAAFDNDLYTPNYVSTPSPVEDGTGLYVDCKGGAPEEMGETFRRILREELGRAVPQAHVRLPRDQG
jgi:hypothetical protein